VEVLRAVDHDIATGTWPDMTTHGWPTDEWPAIYRRVLAADILVPCGPIWLADNSSVIKGVIERLSTCSSLLNDSATSSRPRPTPAGSASRSGTPAAASTTRTPNTAEREAGAEGGHHEPGAGVRRQ